MRSSINACFFFRGNKKIDSWLDVRSTGSKNEDKGGLTNHLCLFRSTLCVRKIFIGRKKRERERETDDAASLPVANAIMHSLGRRANQ